MSIITFCLYLVLIRSALNSGRPINFSTDSIVKLYQVFVFCQVFFLNYSRRARYDEGYSSGYRYPNAFSETGRLRVAVGDRPIVDRHGSRARGPAPISSDRQAGPRAFARGAGGGTEIRETSGDSHGPLLERHRSYEAYRQVCGNHIDTAVHRPRGGCQNSGVELGAGQIDQPGVRERIIMEIPCRGAAPAKME